MTTTIKLDHDLDPFGHRVLGSTDGHLTIADYGVTLGSGNFFVVDGGGTLKWLATEGWTVGSRVYLYAGAAFALASGGSAPAGYAALGSSVSLAQNEITIIVYDGTYWSVVGASAVGAFLGRTTYPGGTAAVTFTKQSRTRWLHYFGRAGGGGGGGSVLGAAGGGAQGSMMEGWIDMAALSQITAINVAIGAAGGAVGPPATPGSTGPTTYFTAGGLYACVGGYGGAAAVVSAEGGPGVAPGGACRDAVDNQQSPGACGLPGFTFFGAGSVALSGSGGGPGGGPGLATGDAAGNPGTGVDGGGGGGARQMGEGSARAGGAGAPGRLDFDEHA